MPVRAYCAPSAQYILELVAAWLLLTSSLLSFTVAVEIAAGFLGTVQQGTRTNGCAAVLCGTKRYMQGHTTGYHGTWHSLALRRHLCVLLLRGRNSIP